MNNQERLQKAKDYIDSMDSNEFEEFIVSCVPYYHLVPTSYNDIHLGKCTVLEEAANMDSYGSDDMCLAA